MVIILGINFSSFVIAFDASVAGQLRGESEHYTDTIGQNRYSLRYRRYSYTWAEAQQSCSRRNTSVLAPPIPELLMSGMEGYGISELELNVWVSAVDGRCRTLKRECKPGMLRPVGFGDHRCSEFHWVLVYTDCDQKRYYVICQSGEC